MPTQADWIEQQQGREDTSETICQLGQKSTLASTPKIDALLAAHAPVAIAVSGGKDSQTCALATSHHLDRIGHRGPRILIHSDLGAVEWKDSIRICRELAAHLGVELVTLHRAAGDLMDRWEVRWDSSLRRYANLDTLLLVPPWSTPGMRFCTSEFKTHLIESELRRRFKGQAVVNVTGVRRQESTARAHGSIASVDKAGKIWVWRPISNWTVEEVFAYIAQCGLAVHPAYTDYGLDRVSCVFCIFSSLKALTAAAARPETLELYRRMVALEILSTFSFQACRWLGDIAPHLLSAEARQGLVLAKEKATLRIALERSLIREIYYTKPWPERLLTDAEGAQLAEVRQQVTTLVGIESPYLDVHTIRERYTELIAKRDAKNAARRRRRESLAPACVAIAA